ncbi:MAG: proton-conducting transporter membrane subunit, partial [Erysipelotrichaceae bacterium]|nr:proton-conducting transporter membrane subunit [Erysipelotrichaceae bacterium]
MKFLMTFAVVFPAIAGIVSGFIKKDQIRNRFVMITLAIQLGLIIYLVSHPIAEAVILTFTDHLSIAFGIDTISTLFLVLITVIWFLVAIYSVEYMKHEDNRARFSMFYLFTFAALMGLSMSKNLITMYLFYEMMTLLSVPLVIHSQSKEALKAGVKYLGYSVFGAGLGLLGIFFIQQFGTTLFFNAGGVLDSVKIVGNE